MTELVAPYTADCGECGGRGGQEVHGPHEWADCPHCIAYADCAFCGKAFSCTQRVPDYLVADGIDHIVCADCFALEPGDE